MKKTTKTTTTKTTARKPAATKTTVTKAPAKVEKIAATKPSCFSGKKLFPTDAAKKTNPRREGSWGQKSLDIIRHQPGITYEAFMRAGGRPVDLRYEVAKGNAEARA
jgi:hypothetical protein